MQLWRGERLVVWAGVSCPAAGALGAQYRGNRCLPGTAWDGEVGEGGEGGEGLTDVKSRPGLAPWAWQQQARDPIDDPG